jgi:hypothetical protein
LTTLFPILKYNLKLRPAEIQDAEFIYRLRLDPVLNKNISKTPGTVADQERWLEDYKKREHSGHEYYFITEDLNGTKWGTTRIYNLGRDYFTLGSWVFLREAPYGFSIKADILTKETGFGQLGYPLCRFDVRKENPTVIRYHKLFAPDLIDEDELNLYFSLSRENFEKKKQKILTLF